MRKKSTQIKEHPSWEASTNTKKKLFWLVYTRLHSSTFFCDSSSFVCTRLVTRLCFSNRSNEMLICLFSIKLIKERHFVILIFRKIGWASLLKIIELYLFVSKADTRKYLHKKNFFKTCPNYLSKEKIMRESGSIGFSILD